MAGGWRHEQIIVPAVMHHHDRAFLRAILNNPAELTAWLAYADWLKGMPGLDGVLAEATAKMRALGVVRKSAT